VGALGPLGADAIAGFDTWPWWIMLLLTATVLTQTVAANAPEAWRATAVWFVLLLCALLSFDQGYERPRLLPVAACGAGALAAGLCLLQVTGHDPLFDNPEHLAVASFGNTNAAGEFLAPLIALSLSLVLSRELQLRVLGLVATPLLVGATVLTGSRGAILGALAGILAFAWFLGVRRRQGVTILVTLAVGLLLPWLVKGADGFSLKSVAESEHSVADLAYPTNVQRLGLWNATVDMIADAPLLGHGPGNYRTAFPPYRDPEEAALVTRFGAPSEAEDPHQQVLLLLAEGGVVSVLLLLAFVLPALLAVRPARALFTETLGGGLAHDVRGPLVAGAAGAIIAILAASLFRSALENPPVAVLFFGLCGSLLVYRPDGETVMRGGGRASASWFGLVVVAAALLAPLVIGARSLRADWIMREVAAAGARDAADTVDAETLRRLDDALVNAEDWDPACPGRLAFHGAFLLRFGDHLGAPGESVDAARQVYRRLLTLYPWSLEGRLGMARACARLGQTDMAERHLAIAHELKLGAPPADWLASLNLLEAGGYDAALAALLASRARAGSLPWSELHDRAAAAASLGDVRKALFLLDALYDLYPFDGDVAYKSGELLREYGQERDARRMFRRAHQCFAVEKLARGDYAGARRSVALAGHYESGSEEEVLGALADV